MRVVGAAAAARQAKAALAARVVVETAPPRGRPFRQALARLIQAAVAVVAITTIGVVLQAVAA